MRNKIVSLSIAVILLFACFVPYLLRGAGQTEQYDVVVFGDSIVAGIYSHNSLGVQFEEMSGMKTLTAAFGGTTMADANQVGDPGNHYSFLSMNRLSENVKNRDFSFAYMEACPDSLYEIAHYWYYAGRLCKVNWNSVKYIIIEHGANDYSAGIPVDNEDDPYDVKTFGGSLRTSVKNLREGAPQAEIVLLTPIYNRIAEPEDCYSHDFGGGLLEDYVSKELEIAQELNLIVVDNFHESGIGPDNFDDISIDGLHINDAGSSILAKCLYDCIHGLEEKKKQDGNS